MQQKSTDPEADLIAAWEGRWRQLAKTSHEILAIEGFEEDDASVARGEHAPQGESDDELLDAEKYLYSRATWLLARKVRQYVAERNVRKLGEYWDEFVRNLDLSSVRLSSDTRERFEEELEELRGLVDFRLYREDLGPGRIARSESLLVQASEELLRRAALDPSILREISPRAFEELVAEIFARLGYAVELTASSRDGGIDLVALQSIDGIPFKLLVECKRYVPPNRVGVGKVRELWGVKSSRSASQAILATTSYFTADALSFQKQHLYELTLRDYDAVVEWVRLANDNAGAGA